MDDPSWELLLDVDGVLFDQCNDRKMVASNLVLFRPRAFLIGEIFRAFSVPGLG